MVGAAVLAALYLTVGLLVLVPGSLATPAAVALTTAAVVLAWVGAAGVARERPLLAELSALGLALLGFWQAVARGYALPAGVVMALAAAVGARAAASAGAEAGSADPDDSDEPVGRETLEDSERPGDEETPRDGEAPTDGERG